MLGVVSSFEQEWLREPLRYVIAIFAIAILVIACNAAMFGLSRLGYSLALNRQIPSLVGRLHPRHDTPVVLIGLGALLAVALVIPADLEFLAAIYAFGATLAFTLVHLSVIRLRFREPDRDRPYKVPFNVRVGRGELPLTAVLGAAMAAVAFASVLALHDAARFVGVGWMVFGVLLYVTYRTVEGKPVFKRVTVPAKALTAAGGRGGVRLDPRARARHAARRRHHADGRAAGGRRERGRRRGRRGDRGAVGLRGADGAAARRARGRRRPAARAPGARARQGGGGGVRGRRGGDRHGARAARRRGDRARGPAARRRGDRARRRGADRHPRRPAARRQAGPARLVRRRDDALRAAEGALPRDPHRAAVGQGRRRPDDARSPASRAGAPGRTSAGEAEPAPPGR